MKTIIALAALLASGTALAATSARSLYESQVVSLVITTQQYDQQRPWDKKSPETHEAQGVVVPGPMIATTADLVENATMVLVEKHGRPLRAAARIAHLDPEANIALLTVDDPAYWKDLQPATFVDSVPTEGQVSTVRWRSGQLEVSNSRVTRVEVNSTHLQSFDHALLVVETDVSGGGWSEPVFDGTKLAGLTYAQSEKTATVIPAEILRAYLDAVRAPGGYREFANFSLGWQVNRDPALTSWLGLDGEPRGILVTELHAGDSGCGALRPRDILLSLDGHGIDAAGFYEHPRYGRLRFPQIAIDGHRAGDAISAEILRDGKKQVVKITLKPARSSDELIPNQRGGVAPGYIVAGGFVLRELDGEFLALWGKDWHKKAPPFLVTRFNLVRSRQTSTNRRVVLLAYVLPSAYTIGYTEMGVLPIARMNGRPINSLADAQEALAHPDGAFHVIELAPNPVRGTVVVDAATMEAATKTVMDQYRIPAAVRLPAPLPELKDCN